MAIFIGWKILVWISTNLHLRIEKHFPGFTNLITTSNSRIFAGNFHTRNFWFCSRNFLLNGSLSRNAIIFVFFGKFPRTFSTNCPHFHIVESWMGNSLPLLQIPNFIPIFISLQWATVNFPCLEVPPRVFLSCRREKASHVVLLFFNDIPRLFLKYAWLFFLEVRQT